MEKICETCFYDCGGNKCEVLREKVPKNCFAWADEAEAKRREKAIKNYIDPEGNSSERSIPVDLINQRTKIRAENLKKRGGKSIKEVLDERFQELYEQGMTDIEIGDKLGADHSRVYDYRRLKGYSAQNKKDRPAPTGTAM